MMQFAPLARADLAACLSVDRDDAHPWGEANWARSLRDDHCLGLWQQQRLLAISAYTLVLDEVSLLNIVVAKACRGQGTGRELLLRGLDWMQQFGAGRCVLEVRVSNAPALALYRQLGFAEDGRRKLYYPLGTSREDAVLMSAELPLAEGEPYWNQHWNSH